MNELRRDCFVPVESLSVTEEMTLFGVVLLPIDDERVPSAVLSRFVPSKFGCVASVPVEGSTQDEMASQGRELVSRALRILRVALRAHRDIPELQLRFRIAEGYALSDSAGGWNLRPDAAVELGLNSQLVELVMAQPVALLPPVPVTDIEKKADVALRWLERAVLTGDPLVALLYLFFALEALLGNKAEGTKAHGLAFRQTMLSHVVEGSFTDPTATFFLYDQVRSAAVHGEDVPGVDWKTVRKFAWVVHRALDQYLLFAKAAGFKRRGRLLRALDEHRDIRQLIAWLRQRGGAEWGDYLTGLEANATAPHRPATVRRPS